MGWEAGYSADCSCQPARMVAGARMVIGTVQPSPLVEALSHQRRSRDRPLVPAPFKLFQNVTAGRATFTTEIKHVCLGVTAFQKVIILNQARRWAILMGS